MPSTPLIACSRGVVTAVSTASALAPVYTATTVTCGGATSGYCATGMVGIARAPARTMTSEQTVARMGRWMKVSTNMGQLAGAGAAGASDDTARTGAPSPIF